MVKSGISNGDLMGYTVMGYEQQTMDETWWQNSGIMGVFFCIDYVLSSHSKHKTIGVLPTNMVV